MWQNLTKIITFKSRIHRNNGMNKKTYVNNSSNEQVTWRNNFSQILSHNTICLSKSITPKLFVSIKE